MSLLPCVPQQAQASQWPVSEPCDGLLRWLEEYAIRLETGVYRSAPLVVEQGISSRGVNLFPQAGPVVTQVVTKGVEITASCIYMPEHQSGGFTYSIRMR